MAKSTPEWHESLVSILERRQRLIAEVKRGRTLSPDARKLAVRAIEDEAFTAAQRVFPRPAMLGNTPTISSGAVTAISPQSYVWGTGNA